MSSTGRNDIDNAVEIIRDAGGRVVGRTRLQKIAYLLEIAGLGAGFDFDYKHYGPYSEQLADAVGLATLPGEISEAERPTSWGGTYSIFTVPAQDAPVQVSPARRQLIATAAKADPIALELAATAAFLSMEGEADPWTETERRKPEKAAKLADARTVYQSLLEIKTPTDLPRI